MHGLGERVAQEMPIMAVTRDRMDKVDPGKKQPTKRMPRKNLPRVQFFDRLFAMHLRKNTNNISKITFNGTYFIYRYF